MGKINREELFKILDEQYMECKSHLIHDMESRVKELEDYKGDVIDIRTEIIIGHSMEDILFIQPYEDYYDKQKLLSVPKGVEAMKHLDGKKLWSIDETTDTKVFNRSVTAPSNKHKKKYLIKLSDNLTHERAIEIAQEIEEQQFICYNKGTIEQIITLDVE